jgi:hypothetical protein
LVKKELTDAEVKAAAAGDTRDPKGNFPYLKDYLAKHPVLRQRMKDDLSLQFVFMDPGVGSVFTAVSHHSRDGFVPRPDQPYRSKAEHRVSGNIILANGHNALFILLFFSFCFTPLSNSRWTGHQQAQKP